MKKVNDYLKEKIKKDNSFAKTYDLAKQKAEIGKKIIKYRIENNLTQTALAKELDITQQYISKLEDGNFSNFETTISVLNKIGYGMEVKIFLLKEKKISFG